MISISEYMRTAPGHIFSAPRWEELKRSIATGTMAGESPIPLIMDTKLALRFRLLVLTFRGREFDCQSGVWVSGGNYSGNYSSLGSFVSAYTAINTTGKPMTVYASGGVSTVNRHVEDGDNCRNTWALSGSVDGRVITAAGTANSSWSKSGTINFIVPAGSSFTVMSSPLPSYGCSPGSFSLAIYS